jgi:methylated-DNA-[protein]-cysteine S-methyltransferase
MTTPAGTLRVLLAAAPAPSGGDVAGLRSRVVGGALRHGLADLVFSTVPSPLGDLLLVGSDRGLLRVAFEREDHDRVLEALAVRVSPRILRAPDRLRGAARQVEQYLAGARRAFDLPLDLRLSRGFRRAVLERLRAVPYGATASYADLAAEAGNPGAVRAAGTACATNPLPIVVPCHRVLRSDGGLGGYLGGPDAKRALLDLEARTRRRRSP